MLDLHGPTPFIILVWLAAMGGSVGSFLNVVVYRLPEGMSLSRPGSHCPKCGHGIRWRDNLPVLGWILLGGRCRDCRSAISVRYPLVEAVTLAIFVLLALGEWAGACSALPVRPYPVPGGFVRPPLGPAEAAGVLAYHLFLMSTLLAAALIEYDGRTVPWRLAGPAAVVGLAGGLFWPFVHPVPALSRIDGWLAGPVDVFAGLAVGVLAGLVVARVARPQSWQAAVMASALSGLYLGWQAAAFLALVCAAVTLVVAAVSRVRARAVAWPLAGSWLLAVLAWILLWRHLIEGAPWLGWP